MHKFYSCLLIFLTLRVSHTSSVKSFWVVIVDLENLRSMFNTTFILFVLQIDLRNVKSQKFQSFFSFFIVLIIHKIDSFFVSFDGLNVLLFFKEVISFFLGISGFFNFLLCTHIPLFLLLILEIKEDDFEIES